MFGLLYDLLRLGGRDGTREKADKWTLLNLME